MTENTRKEIVLMVHVESENYDRFLSLIENGLEDRILNAFYFLTVNGSPVHHRDEHLAPENRLGVAIATIQNDDVLIRALDDTHADRDPQTGIEYGDLT